MTHTVRKFIDGYKIFREKYASSDKSILPSLSRMGQRPEIMMVACCDSRVDPALILQCDPGDLFVVRNVANIVPPFEPDEAHHGTSAALEFGLCHLNIPNLVLLGHSQCGGIQALMDGDTPPPNDFITNWVSIVKSDGTDHNDVDECAKSALQKSYDNCLTFPWIRDRIAAGQLVIHLWFFDIKTGQIFQYCQDDRSYRPL